jgi:hypothetical protein
VLRSGRAGQDRQLTGPPRDGRAFPLGVVDRAQALEALASSPPWSRYRITEPHVVRLGQLAAVVVYSVHAEREGQPPFRAVMSSTFVRHGGD